MNKRRVRISLPEFPDGGKYNWGPKSKAERKKLYNYDADQEAPDMILTLKDDKSFIDGIANWATVSGTEINPAFNDQIKQRLYSGKWGYNPKTGYLVNLEKAKAKDRITTLPESEKKYQKERQDVPYEQAIKNWNKDRVPVQIPDSDAWSPDFEFEGLGKTMNANEMRGQTVYMTQQEADDYLQAQLQSSVDATYRNPIMYAPGMIYTAGAAPALDLLIGTGSSLEPLSRGDYKEAALTFGLGALPFTISKAGTIAKQVDKAIYPKRTWRASSTVGENIDYAADLRTQKLAEKIAKQGEFTTSDLGELEFYLRGNTGRKGLLMGDDMALTEYKVPFWKRNVSENPDVVSLKELQGSPVNKSEYIIPSGGLSKFLYPRKTTLLKGAPEHLTKVGDWDLKGSIPFSYESPMYYTNFAKYLEDQMNAAITPNVSFAKEIPSKVRQVENVSKFRSEIDWRNWVRDKADFDNNPDVIQNLYDIEKRTKADGTWMKNADGTAFEGTPEEFVILQSDRFKQAYPKGYDTWYSGRIIDPNKQFPKIVEAYPEGRSIFGGDRGIATHYSSNKGNIITAADENQTGVFKFISPKSSNSLDIDARGFGWKSIPVDPKLDIIPLWEGKPISDWQRRLKTSYTDELGNIQSGYKIKTDDIASHIENKGIDYANIRNVFDGIDADYVRIHNMKPGNYPKSLSGNILFDLTNPNIYKSLIPAAIATGLLTYSDKFEDGGHSKYGNFFQYPHGGSHYPPSSRVRISLPKYDNGGEKGRVITYKNDAKLIDGTANFDAISGVPISQEYNKQIKDRLYSGKWGYNTATGALVKLKGNQQKTPPKAVRDLRAEEENQRAYAQSVKESGGGDPRLMSGSQTGKVYENWWEDPNYQPTQQEIDEFIKMGYSKANTAFTDVASSIPGIETVADAAGLIKATIEGDKTGMGIYSAGLLLPFVPAKLLDKGKKAITTLSSLVPAKKTIPEASEFIVRSKDKVKRDIRSQMKKIRDLEKSSAANTEAPYLLSKDEVIDRKGEELYEYIESKKGVNEFRRISKPREEDVGIISDYKNIEQLRFAKNQSWEDVKSRTDLFKNRQQFESAKTEANKIFNKYKDEFNSRFGKGRDEEVLIYGTFKDLKNKPHNRGEFYTSDKFAEAHGLSNMDLTPQEKFLADTYQLEFSNLFNKNAGDMDNPRFAQYLSSKFEPIILKNRFQKSSQLVRGSRFDREVRTIPVGSEGISVWKHYDDLEVGDIIYPEHNWSTTSNLTGDVWGEKKAYINVPKGQSAFRPNMYKGTVFPEEEEVVLPSMLGYRVEGINLDAGRNEPRFIFDIHNPYKYGGLFRTY